MYNATNNSWTSFTKLAARFRLAAASLPSGLVFFAGGLSGVQNCACAWQLPRVVLFCRAVTMTMAACTRRCDLMLPRLKVCVVLMHASGSGLTAAVDMYNATSNSWTLHPIGLGQAREMLAAASLPDSGLVFFAGGVGPGV